MPSKSFSGRFPERAVQTCVDAMEAKRLRPSYVSDVLKYTNVDVSPIEEFLDSEDEIVRLNAVKIIGARGDVSKLVPMTMSEESLVVMSELLLHVSKRRDLVEDLAGLLSRKDSVVREQAIAMFRRAGRSDCMMSLLFDEDDGLVSRVKKYMDEGDNDSED